jgi:hypothetical protein
LLDVKQLKMYTIQNGQKIRPNYNSVRASEGFQLPNFFTQNKRILLILSVFGVIGVVAYFMWKRQQ